MSDQNINGYTNEQTTLSDSDWFDIDAYLGVDDYESKKVSFGTIKNQILSQTSNIYNSNGTLTGNRNIDTDGNSLNFDNVVNFAVIDSSNRGINKFKVGAVKYFILSGDYANLQMNQSFDNPFVIDIEASISNNKKGATYFQDYSTGWDNTTANKTLVPLGFVTANGVTANRPTQGITGQQYYNTEEDQLEIFDGSSWTNSEPSIQSKGNAIANFYNYSFNSSQDNLDFFNDGNIKIGWDAPSNDVEVTMLTEPSGTGDMVSYATLGNGDVVSTYITQPNFKYDVYPTGVSALEALVVVISAEQDPDFPTYKMTFHNTGSSYNTIAEIKVIVPKQ